MHCNKYKYKKKNCLSSSCIIMFTVPLFYCTTNILHIYTIVLYNSIKKKNNLLNC